MKDLLLRLTFYVLTSNLKISRRLLGDYVKEICLNTCSAIICPLSTNHIIDLWCCRCGRRFINSLITNTLGRPFSPRLLESRNQASVSRKPRNFSDHIILFVSSKRRCSLSRNLAVILTFIPFTTYEKTSSTE